MEPVPPFKVILLKNLSHDGPLTAEEYIKHFIEAQKTIGCISCLYLLPLFPRCNAIDPEQSLHIKNMANVQNKLACVNTWNTVLFVLGLLGLLANIYGAITYIKAGFWGMASFIIFWTLYDLIRVILDFSQMQSYKHVKSLLGQVSTANPMYQDGKANGLSAPMN